MLPLKNRLSDFFSFLRSDPEEYTADLPLNLLLDISQNNQEIAAEYERLTNNPTAASLEIEHLEEDAGPQPIPLNILEEHVLIHLSVKHRLVAHIEWDDDPDNCLSEFNALLIRHNAPPLDTEEQARILDHTNVQPKKRGADIGYMFGPLAKYAERFNLKIININDATDSYKFTFASDELYGKWVGVKISKGVSVEDPSWQFKKQLRGSPYERFLRSSSAGR